ncbi:MAG: YbaN family protein [Candidatus Bathyarchaeota archaeon]|jgi:hypothetical protein
MEGIKGYIYVVLGTIALALGAVGLLLPVLPTTPFVILAAACYYRGSEKLHTWILNSRWFGELIKNYQEGRGITLNVKIRAICLMWVTIVISAVYFVNNLIVRSHGRYRNLRHNLSYEAPYNRRELREVSPLLTPFSIQERQGQEVHKGEGEGLIPHR